MSRTPLILTALLALALLCSATEESFHPNVPENAYYDVVEIINHADRHHDAPLSADEHIQAATSLHR